MSTNKYILNSKNIVFGRGVRNYLNKTPIKERVLVVTTKRGLRQFQQDEIINKFLYRDNLKIIDTINSYPNITDLQKTINQEKNEKYDKIIAFGGGSVIDSAKVFSIFLNPALNKCNISDFIEDSNQFINDISEPIKLIAMPTTSGTGSEVTQFATIWDQTNKIKLSISTQSILPYLALVDPFLSDNLPYDTFLSTGLDAVNQAMESIWNKNMTTVSEELATASLKKSLHLLPNQNFNNLDKDNLSEASVLSGMAINITRTALCHSISYPITVHFGVPHGLACAFTMPSVLKLNLLADDGRFMKLSQALGSSDLIETVTNMHKKLRVSKRVKAYIKSYEALEHYLGEMYTPERAANNLTDIDYDTISRLIRESWYDY